MHHGDWSLSTINSPLRSFLFLTKAMPVWFVSLFFSALMFFSGTLDLWTTINHSNHPPPRKIQHGKGNLNVAAVKRCFGSKLDASGGMLDPPSFALNALFLCSQPTLIRTWSISLTQTFCRKRQCTSIQCRFRPSRLFIKVEFAIWLAHPFKFKVAASLVC